MLAYDISVAGSSIDTRQVFVPAACTSAPSHGRTARTPAPEIVASTVPGARLYAPKMTR